MVVLSISEKPIWCVILLNDNVHDDHQLGKFSFVIFCKFCSLLHPVVDAAHCVLKKKLVYNQINSRVKHGYMSYAS